MMCLPIANLSTTFYYLNLYTLPTNPFEIELVQLDIMWSYATETSKYLCIHKVHNHYLTIFQSRVFSELFDPHLIRLEHLHSSTIENTITRLNIHMLKQYQMPGKAWVPMLLGPLWKLDSSALVSPLQCQKDIAKWNEKNQGIHIMKKVQYSYGNSIVHL